MLSYSYLKSKQWLQWKLLVIELYPNNCRVYDAKRNTALIIWKMLFFQYVVESHSDTLLPQYLGMYRTTIESKEYYYMVIRSIFSDKKRIHKKYDLKVGLCCTYFMLLHHPFPWVSLCQEWSEISLDTIEKLRIVYIAQLKSNGLKPEFHFRLVDTSEIALRVKKSCKDIKKKFRWRECYCSLLRMCKYHMIGVM